MLRRLRSLPRGSRRTRRAFLPELSPSSIAIWRSLMRRFGKPSKHSRPTLAIQPLRGCCWLAISSASSCCSVPLELGRKAEMRHQASGLVLLLLMLLPWGPAAAQGDIAARRPARPDVALRIYCPSGTLRVTGWTEDSVAVSGYMDPSLGRFFIGGTGEGMKLGIETPETDATGT